VTPATPIGDGEPFTVLVRYAGKPGPVTDPDGSEEGWIPTDDGAVVLPEPQGAPSWFPCNDHPTDKATFAIRVTVPRTLRAIASGELVGQGRHGRTRTVGYVQEQPMATALATVGIGRYRILKGGFAGHQYVQAVDSGLAVGADAVRTRTRRGYRFLRHQLGPYPFSSVGAIVDPNDAGYSLETQTRPVYPSVPGIDLVVHELGHQWVGDSVSLASWDQIWLNEGFATYLEWLYAEKHGGPSANTAFGALYDGHGSGDSTFWNPPPGDPGGPEKLFDDTIYTRGAMALEALRLTVGNDDFFQILRDWVSQNEYGNVTSADFEALAEADSGEQLDGLFDDWLRTPGKPPDPRS
jgi:aminopeptidase N